MTPPSAPGSPAPGDRIGRFLLIEQLGQGGMGVVYRAMEENLGREVALKVIAPLFAHDPDFRRRFTREARAQARLESSHVVAVYAHGEEDGHLYLASQLIPGGDLGHLIRSEGVPTLVEALEIIEQVASGLADAHDAGLVHRDIKPGNVLVRRRPGSVRAYLTDFGIARDMNAEATRFSAAAAGTPTYMAPELHGGARAGASTDLYALGCLLWVALTGAPPYRGMSEYQLVAAHVRQPVPQLAGAGAMVGATNRILRTAMAKEPAERYQRAAEMSADLQAALRLPVTPGAAVPEGRGGTALRPVAERATGARPVPPRAAAPPPAPKVSPVVPPGAPRSVPGVSSGSAPGSAPAPVTAVTPPGTVPPPVPGFAAPAGAPAPGPPTGPMPGPMPSGPMPSGSMPSGPSGPSGPIASYPPVPRRPRWTWWALALLAALAAAGVGVGVALLLRDGGGSADGDPAFLDLEPEEMVRAAERDMSVIDTARIQGEFDEGSDVTSIDVTSTTRGDCRGTLTSQESGGSAEILQVGDALYLRADEKFWAASTNAATAALVVPLIGDRWVLDDSMTESIEAFCDLDELLERDGRENATATLLETTELDGTPVVRVEQATSGQREVLTIRAEAPHHVLRIDENDDAFFTFSELDEDVDITAPGADEIFDLERYLDDLGS